MNHLSLHRRDGYRRLYIQGDLQFDERDERLYHEPLALLPTAIAQARCPSSALRVLILGGGDGLAVREVLKISRVSEVVVIDRDPVVVEWANTRWADLHQDSFHNPKVRVIQADVQSLPHFDRAFDVILMDLTYPQDVEAMPLFTVSFFETLRQRLSPSGLFALNAVSPEKTPAAFGCIARTVQAAGFHVVPYAPEIPSFHAEGYGRWGFVFGSPSALCPQELVDVILPDGHQLPVETRRIAMQWPQSRAFEACPNRSQELLSYITQATPIRWEGPWGAASFGSESQLTVPNLTVAQGFTSWLKGKEGEKTFKDLAAALPLEHQSLVEQRFQEEKESLEVWLSQMDWNTFLDKALERESDWPARWREELRAWREQLKNAAGQLDSLLKLSYRILAILLIALLLANLLYPDNLYAKGYSSHYSGGDGGGSIAFTSMRSPSPYRSHYRSGAWDRSRLYDSTGREYPRLLFTKPGSAALNPLALSATLQLLEDDSVALTTPVPGAVAHLMLGHCTVRTTQGSTLLEYGLAPELQSEILTQIRSQQPMLQKARVEHERWLEWIRWAKWTHPGREAVEDGDMLDRWTRLLTESEAYWSAPLLTVNTPAPGMLLMPGIYMDVSPNSSASKAIHILQSNGSYSTRSVPLSTSMDPADQFLFNLLVNAAAKPGAQDILRFLPPPSPLRTTTW